MCCVLEPIFSFSPGLTLVKEKGGIFLILKAMKREARRPSGAPELRWRDQARLPQSRLPLLCSTAWTVGAGGVHSFACGRLVGKDLSVKFSNLWGLFPDVLYKLPCQGCASQSPLTNGAENERARRGHAMCGELASLGTLRC